MSASPSLLSLETNPPCKIGLSPIAEGKVNCFDTVSSASLLKNEPLLTPSSVSASSPDPEPSLPACQITLLLTWAVPEVPGRRLIALIKLVPPCPIVIGDPDVQVIILRIYPFAYPTMPLPLASARPTPVEVSHQRLLQKDHKLFLLQALRLVPLLYL